eukprot:2945768-Pleurochrysis_carterae.AAC.2
MASSSRNRYFDSDVAETARALVSRNRRSCLPGLLFAVCATASRSAGRSRAGSTRAPHTQSAHPRPSFELAKRPLRERRNDAAQVSSVIARLHCSPALHVFTARLRSTPALHACAPRPVYLCSLRCTARRLNGAFGRGHHCSALFDARTCALLRAPTPFSHMRTRTRSTLSGASPNGAAPLLTRTSAFSMAAPARLERRSARLSLCSQRALASAAAGGALRGGLGAAARPLQLWPLRRRPPRT